MILNCEYCDRICKNKNSLSNHKRMCKLNPNRAKSWFEKQKELGNEYKHSHETIRKIKEARAKQIISEDTKQILREKTTKYYSNPENVKKHSERMKQVVLDNPESYSDKNIVGRSKHFTVDGVRYNSTWEYRVAQYLTESSIKWIRSKIEPEKYYWNDSWHFYFPDFYLEEYDCYVEVKGYETDRDRAKWRYSTKKIIIIKQKELALIENNCYDIFGVIGRLV